MGRDSILPGRDETETGQNETRQNEKLFFSKNPNRDKVETFDLSIYPNRDISRRDKVGTRRDETAFLVSSRREILDFKFLDPSLLDTQARLPQKSVGI